ncbi:hypothetical protein BEN47_18010 [Hymenobacter lapidarius]|uniref:Uncharacterized protein n=1 Tax=Hymenobacter lapidarius TaxID=1908237 RepID=A0A1G1SWD2_9BACT|nr:hypothetical protein [Hymenobacter lapidarius]OGX82913.1 hypothetical protein BEN47_18010 [Hymenobacter lapidarius]
MQTIHPSPHKTAYQRPYKSRNERRQVDRSKHDESSDYKFLVRVGIAIGVVIAVVLGFVIKGLTEG